MNPSLPLRYPASSSRLGQRRNIGLREVGLPAGCLARPIMWPPVPPCRAQACWVVVASNCLCSTGTCGCSLLGQAISSLLIEMIRFMHQGCSRRNSIVLALDPMTSSDSGHTGPGRNVCQRARHSGFHLTAPLSASLLYLAIVTLPTWTTCSGYQSQQDGSSQQDWVPG